MSNYKNHISRLDSPAEYAFSITPSDSTNLPNATRGIYIGGDGNLNLRTIGGSVVVFQNLVAGTVLPVRATAIYSSNTSATGLIGLY